MAESFGAPHRTPAGRRNLRIAFFTETFLPRIDGTVTRLSHTIRHLRASGHEILVIAPDGGIKDFEGARVHGVPGFPFPLYPEQKVAIPGSSVANALVAFRPDLIHALHPVLVGASAFHYSYVLRVPLVISHHAQLHKWLYYYGLGALEAPMWWAVKTAYNRADLVLVTSNMMRGVLSGQGIRRVELWQRGIDTDTFRPEHASEEMRTRLTQGHSQDKLLLYVGRLSAEKEIEQCRLALEAIPGLRLALVGDGPHRSKLEEHFAGTPTYFTGFLRGTELAAAFASADAFFLPSRTETLGLVLLEAMAAGCPVVAAAAGGVLDIVQDGVTGHLYDPRDPTVAIAAIRRLVCDSAHREFISRNARLEAQKWGWPAATEQLENFYHSVIKRDRELPQQIRERRRPGTSPKSICDTLEISLATFHRHVPDQRRLIRGLWSVDS